MFPRSRVRYYCDRMGNCLSRFSARFRPNRVDHRSDRNSNFLIDTQSLVVREIDFMIEKNSWNHNTHKFHLSKTNEKLVVRRGTPFKLKVKFNRRINKDDDIINIIFTIKDAKNPIYSKNTTVIVPVVLHNKFLDPFSSSSSAWHAKASDIDENNLLLEVTTSVDSIIGEWNLNFDTKSMNYGNSSLHSNPIKKSIIILFNPWHKKDLVYMKDNDARNEYVLNDNGIIWRGTHERLKPTPWSYSQHEINVLECCLYALSHVGKLNVEDRGDPIKVARHISSIVNSVDDNGIVVGNWKEDFSGGTKPTEWLGSFAIMQKFYKTKKPVKFGQCWVFSGVTNTIARCIGIPARVVTNYQSAHDTHGSLTVDRFFDEEGEPLKEHNVDSIWNFHSWNEAWMRRPDLSYSSQYDGWQVIDATPQEMSDGLYRCGPASVHSVKKGETNKPYDGKFVFAEVNADEVFWLYQGPKQPVKLISESTNSVGVKLTTKSIASDVREDITDNYKYEELSREERDVFLKALRTSKSQFSRYYLNEKFEDIKFDFLLLDDVLIGKSFTVRLKISNKSDRVYTIRSIIGIRTTLYTGITKSLVKKDIQELKIGPKAIDEVQVPITYDEYEKHLADQSMFNITVMASVEETESQYYAMDDFRLRMPDIIIQTEGDLIVGVPFTCHVFFTNPLPRSITKGVFLIEGPENLRTLRLPLKKSVLPDEEARVSFVVTPRASGKKTISAKFISREINDADGYKNIRVSPNVPFGSNEINNNLY